MPRQLQPPTFSITALRSRLSYAVSLLALLLSSALAAADINPPEIETSKKFGRYVVFYNVFPSTDLQADIAARYNIDRADDQMVVNVSLREAASEHVLPQPATITASYSDLMTAKPLEFREIREAGAIYYVAQLRVHNRQLLRFDISVQPLRETATSDNAPVSAPLALSFTRRFELDR